MLTVPAVNYWRACREVLIAVRERWIWLLKNLPARW